MAASGDGLPSSPPFGGAGPDLSALRHALAASGIAAPSGEPLSEAMVYGLMGGPGFMAFVFEYKGMAPTMTIVARSFSLPDPLVDGAVERLGIAAQVTTTGSAKAAAKGLREALDAGRPALVTVDSVKLPWTGLPREWPWGGFPQLLAVVGGSDGRWQVDGGAHVPLELGEDELAAARASLPKVKHRQVIFPIPPAPLALGDALRRAIHATARAYTEAPFKGFGSNFGLRGMARWCELLVDPKDKRGWPQLFAAGEAHARARLRLVACLEREYTPPHAGRALYAAFLREAAAVIGEAWPAEAADLYDASAARWGGMAARARQGCGPELDAAFAARDAAELAFKEGGMDGAAPRLAAYRAAEAAAKASSGSLGDDPTVFADIAALAKEALDLETRAVQALSGR